MDFSEFERIAEEEYDALPEGFKSRIHNVRVIVEELPRDDQLRKVSAASRYSLLGLYEGVPLNHRNTGYGTYPIVPDTITLFKHNIESVVAGDVRVRVKIREVLIHEIGHYFGMTEDEVRKAGY
ncbi:MAG TPA: Zn-dependent protease [Bacteroidetes bacterium]|jgi:predicted Zn-dependent protease with MMP-like domain|nr:Zn-dependent protease [Bacteroidota bacterium]